MLNYPDHYDWFAYEAITVSNSVKTLTAAKYAPADVRAAQVACITTEDDAIRYNLDGSTPSATEGHELAKDKELTLRGQNAIRNFKAIRVTADAKIRVSYGKL